MKTLLHETGDVVFSLIEKQGGYYVEIICNSKNYLNIIAEVDLNLFSVVAAYFDEHNDHEIGVIIAATEQPFAAIILSKVVELIAEWWFAESEDIDTYDGINFPFKWVAIQENERFFVAYSVTGSIPVGSAINLS